MLDSKAEVIASIIRFCHLKSPVLKASSWLRRRQEWSLVDDSLQIHRHPAFPKDDWDLAKTPPSALDDVLDLKSVVLLHLFTPIQASHHGHAL